MSFDARFIHPFSMCLAGPSQSGKTTFIYFLLASAPRLINAPIDYVVCFLGSNDKTLERISRVFWHENSILCMVSRKVLSSISIPQKMAFSSLMT